MGGERRVLTVALSLLTPRPTGHVCEQPVCDDGDRQPQQPGRGGGPAAAGGGPGLDQHLPPVLRDVHHIQEVWYETLRASVFTPVAILVLNCSRFGEGTECGIPRSVPSLAQLACRTKVKL